MKSRSRRSAKRPTGLALGGGGRGGFDLLSDRRDVEDLDDARDWVDVEPLAFGPVDRVVVCHDAEQRVPGVAEADYDAAPEFVDTDGTDAVVAAGVELLEMDASCCGLLELVWEFADLLSDDGLELGEVVEELLGEDERGHQRVPVVRAADNSSAVHSVDLRMIHPWASAGVSAPAGRIPIFRAGHATSITRAICPLRLEPNHQVSVPLLGDD